MGCRQGRGRCAGVAEDTPTCVGGGSLTKGSRWCSDHMSDGRGGRLHGCGAPAWQRSCGVRQQIRIGRWGAQAPCRPRAGLNSTRSDPAGPRPRAAIKASRNIGYGESGSDSSREHGRTRWTRLRRSSWRFWFGVRGLGGWGNRGDGELCFHPWCCGLCVPESARREGGRARRPLMRAGKDGEQRAR